MQTIRFEREDIEIVAQLLEEGNVVAFPTDTVYGLGVIYYNEEALDALKVAKGRPDEKPIPTMVSNMEQLEEIAYLDEDAKKLAEAFMPGAFTIIVKKKESVPAYITNGFSTIGVRMPEDDFVLALIEKCGKPLLVTSANRSGEETGVVDTQVLKQLDGRIDAIVMGEARGKTSSTIVDVTNGIKIVREGPVSKAMVEQVLGKSVQ